MGLFDGLEGALQNALAQQGGLNGLFTQALGKAGGYDGILSKLNEAGLGTQVSSWLGKGTNLPVSADQLQAALGNTQLRQLATSFGVPVDQVAAFLAEHLPTAVDQASPNGAVTPAAPIKA